MIGRQAAHDTGRAGAVKGGPGAAHNLSGLYQLKCTHTIAFPVSSVGGEAQAMRCHRKAFPTPRGDGKSDPKGGVARLPDGVARRL